MRWYNSDEKRECRLILYLKHLNSHWWCDSINGRGWAVNFRSLCRRPRIQIWNEVGTREKKDSGNLHFFERAHTFSVQKWCGNYELNTGISIRREISQLLMVRGREGSLAGGAVLVTCEEHNLSNCTERISDKAASVISMHRGRCPSPPNDFTEAQFRTYISSFVIGAMRLPNIF